VARALRRDHRHVYVLRRHDLVEVDVEVPRGQSFKVFFDEAASAGGDGESFYYELTAEEDGRNLYKFDLSDLKLRSSYGNQNGNKGLDMQAVNSIAVNFEGLKGTGTVTVYAVKLRKSESFFTRYFWYFMTMSIFFFLAYTVFATPFVALGYEMTPDYHERTRLQAVL